MRKLVILLLCVALIWCVYQVIAIGLNVGDNCIISSHKAVSVASREIDTLISQVTNINDIQYEESKNSLESAIKKYKDTKEEYESLTEFISDEEPDISLVDTYDIDFLWTTIGNYGTEEGISLKFNVTKSVGTLLSTTSYTMCDLKFTVSGDYIPITDFIYDLEDDRKLGFEISDFKLAKGGENLQATFTVENVPITNKNLSDITTTVIPNTTQVDEYENPILDENAVDATTSTGTTENENTTN